MPLVSRSRPCSSMSWKRIGLGPPFLTSLGFDLHRQSDPLFIGLHAAASRPQVQRRPSALHDQTWPISPAAPRPSHCLPSRGIRPPRADAGSPPDPENRLELLARLPARTRLDRDRTSLPIGTRRPSSSGAPARAGNPAPSRRLRDIEDVARLLIDGSGGTDADAGSPSGRRLRPTPRAGSRRSRGRPHRGRPCSGSRAALPRALSSLVHDDRLDLRAPESIPPFILVTEAIVRPPRSACGSPGRSTLQPCAGRHRAVAPGSRTRGRSPASRPRPRRAPGGRARRPRSRSDTRRFPSAQAARSMLWAVRPAWDYTGPTSRARGSPRRALRGEILRTKTAPASSSIRDRPVGTTNVQGWEFRDDPESRPASSNRSASWGARSLGSVRRSSRRLAIASSVSTSVA